MRLLERLDPDGWRLVLAHDTEERKEFVRAIDAVKKRTQREKSRAPLHPEAVADPRESQARHDREERAALRQAAGQLLSARQQNILEWTCDGWTIPDMARALSTSPERISDEKYKAIQKMRGHFGART